MKKQMRVFLLMTFLIFLLLGCGEGEKAKSASTSEALIEMMTAPTDPPADLGKPQAGDLLYRLSTFNDGKSSGWTPAHVGIYVDEQIWNGENEKFVSADVKRCGKFNVVEALIGKGVIYSYYKISNTVQSCEVETTFEGDSVYMGAREPANFTLTEYQRKMGVRFVIAQIGKPYTTDETAGVMFGLLTGINVKGLMEFNCVGLAERMLEEYGANERQGIMLDDSNKTLTPFWQYGGTKPAVGITPVIVQVTPILQPGTWTEM